MKSIDDLVLGTGSVDTNQSEQPKISSIDDLVLGVKPQEQGVSVDIPDQTIPSHLMADKVSEQPSELPSLSSANPYSNKVVDEAGVGQDNLSVPQSNEPTFMSQVWDAFSKTGQDLKGLVMKDGVPNITELNRGVAQFGLAIPGFITGAVNGSARAVEELVKQQGEILGDSFNFTKPPKQMNLDKIVDAFSTGMDEANKFFQPGVETLTGKPTESSELVGKVAMAPFETINYLGNQLAKSKMLEDSPNIRGAIRILSNVAGLAVNGALMDPNHVFSSKVEERNVKSFKDIVDTVKPLESEILDTINTGHAAEGLDGVQKVAAEKIFEIKKKQTEINIQNALDRLSKSKYVDEDLAWTEEQAARNRTFPVQDSGLGLKRPGKKAIESVTQDIGPSDTIQPDRLNIKQTEESTNAIQEQSTTGVGAHEGGDQSTGRSVESQGVGQGQQGKEVAKESEEGKVVDTSGMTPEEIDAWYKINKAGELPQGGDLNGLQEGKTEGEVIPPEPIPPSEKTPMRKKVSVKDKNSNELKEYFTPGNIVKTYYGHDKVLDYSVDEKGNFVVTSQAVIKDADGNWIVDPKNGEVRTHSTSPSEKELKKGPIEKVSEQPSTPPPPEPINSVDKVTGTEPVENTRTDGTYFTDKEETLKLSKLYEENAKKVKGNVELALGKLINDVNLWLHREGNVDIGVTRKIIDRFATDKNFRQMFDTEAEFLNFQENAREVATWASRADRSKIEQTMPKEVSVEEVNNVTNGSTKLYSDPFGLQIVYNFLKNKFFTNKTGSRRNNIDWSKIKNDEVKGALDKAIGFAESMDKDRRFSEGNIKGKLKEGFYTTYEVFLDTKVRAEMELRMASKSNNPELRRAAEESLIKMVNESGGHSAGQVNFELFNDKVFGGLSKSDINILNTLIRGKRVQDIANYRPKAKFPKGQDFEAAVYYDAFHQMIEGIDEVKSKDLLSRREAYFNGMKELVDLLVEHGILDEEAGNRLKSHDYSMFKGIGQRIDRGEGVEVESLFDERVPSRVGGKLQSVQSSGIERLAHGKSSDILEPDQRITALEMYNRVYGRIFRNDTFKSLAEVAKAQPDNGFIRLTDKAEEAAIANAKDKGIAVDNLPAKDKRGWIKHYYWEDGKKHVMWLSTDFADAMGSMGRDLSPRAVAWVKLASFAGVKRAMLTGLSPLWSTFVNFTADQLTVFLTNHTYENGKRVRLYSTNPILSSLQMGSDLKDVFYDVFFRANYKAGKDSLYMDAVNKGLLMPFMTTQARITGKGYKLPGTWSKLQDIAAYHGESMEMWTRMAIANRVIKRRAQKLGISFEEARKLPEVMGEATAMARDYLDFSRGGWLTKLVDQLGAIYLNAGVQVSRKYYQAMKEDPVGTTAAIIQGIGVPTVGITLASALLAKKTYKEIPSYQDENNLNIPLSDNFRFKDSMGNERGLYISLPIGSHAGMMKNIFKEATQYYLFKAGLSDKEPDMKTISGSMKGSLPNPNMMPPSIQAITEALMNKDFRTGQDITPKTFSYPRMGTGEVQLGKTPQMAVDFGKATGLSPDRSAKFVDTLIGNNEWTALVGAGYDKLYSDLPKDVREESFALMISKVPGFKRVFKSTISGGDRTDVQKEIKEESEFPRWVERMTLQYYSKVANWQGSNEAKDKVREMLRNKEVLADPDRFDRLFNLNEFVRSIEKLPDRNSWLSMWHESAEAKAKDYLDRERRAKTPEEQTQLRKEFAIVCSTGGYDSGAFWESYGKLRAQGWKVH